MTNKVQKPEIDDIYWCNLDRKTCNFVSESNHQLEEFFDKFELF